MTLTSNQDEAVRVLVVDDQQLIRDGIAALIGLQEGIVVVGTAANGQEAVSAARTLQPDIVLMDVRMPLMDGVAATATIRQELPHCQVLMLTTFDDEDYIVDALRAGAVGYLLKDLPDQDLARAIHAARRSIYQFDATVARKVVAALSLPRPAPLSPLPAHELSARELDVVRQIARGATNRAIAATLVISEGTVKSHISNVLSRLGLRDRTQVAMYARDHGLV